MVIQISLLHRLKEYITFFYGPYQAAQKWSGSSISFLENQQNRSYIINMISRVKQTCNLADIYPDTSAELCNKHVKLLSSLKNTFEQIYDDMEPEKYVIVNGVAKVLDLGSDTQLSFALENGVTVLLKKTYQNEDIYINGNHIEEEIIFNSHGKHIEGIHEKVDEIRDMIHIIRNRSSKNKPFFGAILYVHSNIGQNLFSFQECFMLGVLIALIYVHDELQSLNKAEILGILQAADETLSSKVISNILDDYEINKCSIQYPKTNVNPQSDVQISLTDPISDKSIGTHESNESIKSNTEQTSFKSVSDKGQKPLQSTSTGSHNSISSLQETTYILKEEGLSFKVDLGDSNKLILCRLDLSHEQLQAYGLKMKKVKEITENLSQSKQDVLQLTATSMDSSMNEYVQENTVLLNSFKQGKVEFASFLKQKHELDIQYNIFDQEVVELIDQIKLQSRFIKSFCIIEGSVLLISMEKQHYAEIMCYLRRLLNDYKMSTHHFLQTKHRFDEDKLDAQIGEIMFTSSASAGCAIYTSTEDAWI